MRSIPQDLQEFIESLVEREFSVYDVDQEEHTFLRLMRSGVIMPYGDTFAYDGKAVLVVGESSSGKTSLVQKFKAELGDRVKILAQDDPIIYWDGESPPVTYRDLRGSVGYPFFEPLIFRGNLEEFELDAVIQLTADGSRKVKTINILELSDTIIGNSGHPTTPELEGILVSAMRNAHVFAYGKNHGYRNDADLDLTFRDIVAELDRLRR